jgi:hypothetical protein
VRTGPVASADVGDACASNPQGRSEQGVHLRFGPTLRTAGQPPVSPQGSSGADTRNQPCAGDSSCRGRLPVTGVCSRAAMRSRCSGVSGGNESTTARTCSASTAAARSWVAGSISDAVAVGRACSALLRVLVVLNRFFEWFGLFVRYFLLPSGDNEGGWSFDASWPRPPPAGAEYAHRPVGDQLVSVAASEAISSVTA